MNSATGLIVMRAFMGVGGAVILPLSLSILPTMFLPAERPRAIAVAAAAAFLGLPFGPLVAGWLLTHFEWGSVFLINAPVVVIALLGVAFLVPESKDREAPRLDWIGAVLAVVGVTCLVYGIIEEPRKGWADPQVLIGMVGGTVLLGAFVALELRARSPLVDMRLFLSPRFTWATIAFTAVGFAMTGVMFVLSPYLQIIQGNHAQRTGIRLLPMIAGVMAGAIGSDRLTARLGTKIMVAGGLVVSGAGLVLLSRAGADTGYGLVAVGFVVAGLGIGFAMPPALDAVLGALPAAQTGVGSALTRTLQQVGASFAVAVLGSILNNAYRAGLSGHLAGLPAQVQDVSLGSVAGAAAVAQHLPAPLAAPILRAAQDAYASGMGRPDLPARPAAAPMMENPIMTSSGHAQPSSPGAAARGSGGLRERKKQKTRDAIQREAMRLFQEQGYDATTIEQIAEAVEISPSTFFNYFPTKEDVVFYDPYDPLIISTFLGRPSDEPLSVAIRRTFSEELARILERDREIILARARLMMGVPALRARIWEDMERAQDLFCTVIAQRTGRDPDDFELRVTTMMVISAMYVASREWLRHEGRGDIMALVNRVLDLVEAGARLDDFETAASSRGGRSS